MTATAEPTLHTSAIFPVGDPQQLSTVRFRATALGRSHGLDPDAVCRLGIVVAELAANITKHAKSGQIILRTIGAHASGCVEVLALDKGPGIADMNRVMREGPVTSDGTWEDGGLTGVKRLSELFDIYSQTGKGTAIVAHFGSRRDVGCQCGDTVVHGCIGVVCVPLLGEAECGDAWEVAMHPGHITALLVDGLGHGPGAAAAALKATNAFASFANEPPELMLRSMHGEMRETRGAALSVTTVNQASATARFCGVGNVDGRVVSPDLNKHLVPQSGIVGHKMPKTQGVDVEWPSGGTRLVMHSDGISPKWHMSQYPGLLARHPALMAGIIFRDFARPKDDATVLVIREAIPTAA